MQLPPSNWNYWHNVYRYLRRMMLGVIVANLTWLTGCSQPSVGVSEVLNHQRCNGLVRGIREIQMHDLAKVRGVQMLQAPTTSAKSAAPAHEQSNQDAGATPISLFAVSNGSQPTPGYGFELLNATAAKEDVQLHYAWRTPAADAVLAQVITSPCSVVQLTSEPGTDRPMPKISTVSAWLDDELLGRIAISASN